MVAILSPCIQVVAILSPCIQVVAILTQLGDDFSERAQLVLVPPDKANHAWWGPQRALWSSLTDAPALSFVEWARLQPQWGESRLVRVPHAVFALSGFHSVYGRGPVGHAFEAACRPCAGAAGGSGGAQMSQVRDRVSPFYRAFLGLSLARLGQLEPAAAAATPAHWLRALWISRGKGHGGAYGSTVARRCLNEDALRAAAARAAAQDEARGERAVRLSAVELADLPFTQQLPLFRSAAILTGMHGAGCAPPATRRDANASRQLPHCLMPTPGRCEPDLSGSWVGGRRAVPARLLHQLVRAHRAPARAHLRALDEQHPSQREEKLRHHS